MAYHKIPFSPSSNIADLEYDPDSLDLRVTWVRQGRQGIVHQIDSNTVAELSRARSAGRFYYSRIRDIFEYEEI